MATSNQKVPESTLRADTQIQALYFETDAVGKSMAGSKVKYTWVLEVKGKRHQIDLTSSRLSGRRKVFMDGRLLYEAQTLRASVFQYTWPMGQHLFAVTWSGLDESAPYDLTINGLPFESFLRRKISRAAVAAALSQSERQNHAASASSSQHLQQQQQREREREREKQREAASAAAVAAASSAPVAGRASTQSLSHSQLRSPDRLKPDAGAKGGGGLQERLRHNSPSAIRPNPHLSKEREKDPQQKEEKEKERGGTKARPPAAEGVRATGGGAAKTQSQNATSGFDDGEDFFAQTDFFAGAGAPQQQSGAPMASGGTSTGAEAGGFGTFDPFAAAAAAPTFSSIPFGAAAAPSSAPQPRPVSGGVVETEKEKDKVPQPSTSTERFAAFDDLLPPPSQVPPTATHHTLDPSALSQQHQPNGAHHPSFPLPSGALHQSPASGGFSEAAHGMHTTPAAFYQPIGMQQYHNPNTSSPPSHASHTTTAAASASAPKDPLSLVNLDDLRITKDKTPADAPVRGPPTWAGGHRSAPPWAATLPPNTGMAQQQQEPRSLLGPFHTSSGLGGPEVLQNPHAASASAASQRGGLPPSEDLPSGPVAADPHSQGFHSSPQGGFGAAEPGAGGDAHVAAVTGGGGGFVGDPPSISISASVPPTT
uniref:Uncharacterized protein n=1 Tax=Chromera velia CCMP2878 TaxID=1169474 RepID=A0A0G4I6Q4_9ALVE|eukprot:Cvel_11441.t1-p1 / transcript=Cvel_11441.t1 / gene=Cvel_11441 / organism=Chromera_velia_CCMP2878 / gene_product=hypothetical protein / transcript_product=hypothetical protein / location=Cvel_scaffold719:66098-69666(-) / protein_length=651 / sequence_SO=supercontig / SO=protein_coding / is_pseudo=false